jgi:hypothetical protein
VLGLGAVLFNVAGLSFADAFSGLTIEDWSGTGVNTAALVVDFAPGNGASDSFAFGVRFGTSPSDTITGLQLLQAVYDGNPNFDFHYTQFDNGAYVDEIAYKQYDSPPIPNPTGVWWTYWTSSSVGQPWTSPDFGCSSRIVSNGSIDGWLAQATGDDWNPNDWSQPIIPCQLAGDANMDGTVNLSDLGTLIDNFGKPGNWLAGDFNYDGKVDLGDLGELINNFGKSAPVGSSVAIAGMNVSTVPEPSMLALSAIGGLALFAWCLCRRKRRQSAALR